MPFLHASNPLFVLSGSTVGFLIGRAGIRCDSLMTPLHA
jgi:hypothetical protein